MKTIGTVEDLRNGTGKPLPNSNGRLAVIVTLPISKRKQDLGVQFWTNNQIKDGEVKNTDETISKLICLY